MLKHLFLIALSINLYACALKGGLDVPTSPSNSNDEVYQATEAITQDIFSQEQPKLNAAITNLPPASQAMAQAAYKAVQAAIQTAESRGVSDLPDAQRALALKAIQDLSGVADVLHTAIHEADARAPSP